MTANASSEDTDRAGSNPLAVIAFVVALVGLFGFVMGIGALGSISDDQLGLGRLTRIAFPAWAAIALVLGILGRTASRAHGDRRKGLATTAIVLAIVELIGATYFVFAITGCMNDVYHCR
ncbi:MAG TPA: hypothetical protein VK646_00950 [Actinomycetota bacterium]|nr:hypothetical protein [Actinomycetota bacterium]